MGPSYLKEFKSGSLKQKADEDLGIRKINRWVLAKEIAQALGRAVEAGLYRIDQRKRRRIGGSE
jgi:hypothetical protein